MDESKLPVSLNRLFTRVKQSFKEQSKSDKMLTGAQIMQLSKQAVAKSNVKNPSNKFVKALQTFIEDIAQQVTHLQSKFSDETFLRNFTFLTMPEYQQFI